MDSKEQLLQAILDRAVDDRKVFGTSFCISYGDLSWCGSSGNLAKEGQYFMASTTKLFVTAVILHYRSVGLLSLDDAITKFLPSEILNSLHVLKGRDYTQNITIRL